MSEMSRVIVAGNLTTDVIISGVDRLPEWGREVAGNHHRAVTSGQAAYLAFGLEQLGVKTRLVGIVGDDSAGEAICTDLSAAGVDISSVERPREALTSVTVALVGGDGERAFVSDFACQWLFDADFLELHAGAAATPLLCLVGLFNLPGLPPDRALATFARARAAGAATVLDTGWDPAGWPETTIEATHALLRETDIFLPNSAEAEALTGKSDPEQAARALADESGSTVIVKCGADGSVARANGRTEHVSALAGPVLDTVGAGDSFDAGFLYAYLKRKPLRACLEFATATAAIYIARTSDRWPTAAEVTQLAEREGLVLGTA